MLKKRLFPDKETPTPTTVELNAKPQNNQEPAIMAPRKFSEVEACAIELKNSHHVIIDLTKAEEIEARRIVDFLNGLTFAFDGQVTKVAKLIYMFTI